jgi:nicotinic acid mononucleotide adenylyltransferase
MSTQRHVAVFGLSANPPTHACGHGGIVRVVAPLVDEVRRASCGMSLLPAHARACCQLWVLPVFQHAFSAKANLAPFEHRLRMCELGLAAAAPAGAVVRVLDTERRVCEAEAQARRTRQ